MATVLKSINLRLTVQLLHVYRYIINLLVRPFNKLILINLDDFPGQFQRPSELTIYLQLKKNL